MKNVIQYAIAALLITNSLGAETVRNASRKKHTIQKKNYQHNQLQHISSGEIDQLNEWARKAVRSNNYVKYIRAKLVASRAENAAAIFKFLPSVDITFGQKHLFLENGKKTGKKFKQNWDNKTVTINFLKMKNSLLTDTIAAKMKSKADLEEYWENWSKFCLEEIYDVLIDWIGEKSNVELNQEIVQSRRDLVKKINARIETGTMNISDLYSAQSNLAKAETKLFIVQNKEKVLRNKLDELSGGLPLPSKIGSISKYGDWNHNKAKILLGSHTLQKEYYSKKYEMAKNVSNLTSAFPSLYVGMSFDKKSNRYTAATGGVKWMGSFDLTLKQHIGLDSVANLGVGVNNINAARLQYFEAIRKTITSGYQIFAEVENGMQELDMHKKSLNISEKSLKTKKSLFFNDLDLPGRRKVSIDDVIYAENDVSYEYEKFIEIYQKVAKNYFKLMHMRGEIANQIGDRRKINRTFEQQIQKDREESKRR